MTTAIRTGSSASKTDKNITLKFEDFVLWPSNINFDDVLWNVVYFAFLTLGVMINTFMLYSSKDATVLNRE